MSIQQLEMTSLALFWLSIVILLTTLGLIEYDNYRYRNRNNRKRQ